MNPTFSITRKINPELSKITLTFDSRDYLPRLSSFNLQPLLHLLDIPLASKSRDLFKVNLVFDTTKKTHMDQEARYSSAKRIVFAGTSSTCFFLEVENNNFQEKLENYSCQTIITFNFLKLQSEIMDYIQRIEAMSEPLPKKNIDAFNDFWTEF